MLVTMRLDQPTYIRGENAHLMTLYPVLYGTCTIFSGGCSSTKVCGVFNYSCRGSQIKEIMTIIIPIKILTDPKAMLAEWRFKQQYMRKLDGISADTTIYITDTININWLYGGVMGISWGKQPFIWKITWCNYSNQFDGALQGGSQVKCLCWLIKKYF